MAKSNRMNAASDSGSQIPALAVSPMVAVAPTAGPIRITDMFSPKS